MVRRFLVGTSIVFVILLIGSQAGHAQSDQTPLWDNGIGHRAWTIALEPEDKKKMLALWNSIGEDLKNESNPLAGTYVKGGYDSGYFLRWSIKEGFVVIPYFDQNLITDYGHGKVTFVDNSEVNFAPEKQLKDGRGLGKMPLRWTAIWGHFAAVDWLGEFAEYRAGLGDYNDFNGDCCDFVPESLTHRVDRLDRAFPGEVPAKYKHFIRNPIIGRLTTIGRKQKIRDRGFSGKDYYSLIERGVLIRVRVDAGRADGVKRRMLFRIIGEPVSSNRYVQIIKVGPRSSLGFVVHEFSENGNEDTYRDHEADQNKPLPIIRVGTRVTTSPVID